MLSDKEIGEIHGDGSSIYSGDIAFAKAIEAKVRERTMDECMQAIDILKKQPHGWNSLSYTTAINDSETAILALKNKEVV